MAFACTCFGNGERSSKRSVGKFCSAYHQNSRSHDLVVLQVVVALLAERDHVDDGRRAGQRAAERAVAAEAGRRVGHHHVGQSGPRVSDLLLEQAEQAEIGRRAAAALLLVEAVGPSAGLQRIERDPRPRQRRRANGRLGRGRECGQAAADAAAGKERRRTGQDVATGNRGLR
jgi:hypothetical protein